MSTRRCTALMLIALCLSGSVPIIRAGGGEGEVRSMLRDRGILILIDESSKVRTVAVWTPSVNGSTGKFVTMLEVRPGWWLGSVPVDDKATQGEVWLECAEGGKHHWLWRQADLSNGLVRFDRVREGEGAFTRAATGQPLGIVYFVYRQQSKDAVERIESHTSWVIGSGPQVGSLVDLGQGDWLGVGTVPAYVEVSTLKARFVEIPKGPKANEAELQKIEREMKIDQLYYDPVFKK